MSRYSSELESVFSVCSTKKGPTHKYHLAGDLQKKRKSSSAQIWFHRCAIRLFEDMMSQAGRIVAVGGLHALPHVLQVQVWTSSLGACWYKDIVGYLWGGSWGPMAAGSSVITTVVSFDATLMSLLPAASILGSFAFEWAVKPWVSREWKACLIRYQISGARLSGDLGFWQSYFCALKASQLQKQFLSSHWIGTVFMFLPSKIKVRELGSGR